MLHGFCDLKGCSSYFENQIKIISFNYCSQPRNDLFHSQKFNLHEYILQIQRKQLFDVFILTKTNICLRFDQFYYNDKMGDQDHKTIPKECSSL